MPRASAGILLHRAGPDGTEVLLIHPGGPFFARKDRGVWSIPKGELAPGEDALAAARREFAEETGGRVEGDCALLGTFPQPGGKLVTAFATAGDLDLARFRSNTFDLEWPPHSGRIQPFPEADRAGWFGLDEAAARIVPGQRPMLAALADLLAKRDSGPAQP